MKKIYRIKITAVSKPGIWYESKLNTEYDAELGAKGYSDKPPVVFFVNPCQFVYPVDCKIIGERLVKNYTK